MRQLPRRDGAGRFPAGSAGTSRERIFLVGMMGAGKSTVARALAQRLGWAWADTDDDVTARCGCSIGELWRSRGEAAFRAAETAAIEAVVAAAAPTVVALGGGAVLAPANRERIAAAGLVVWLRAEVDTLACRVGDGIGRPLLGASDGFDRSAGPGGSGGLIRSGGPGRSDGLVGSGALGADAPSAVVALARLDAERRPVYQSLADLVVDVDGRSVEEIAATVADAIVTTTAAQRA